MIIRLELMGAAGGSPPPKSPSPVSPPGPAKAAISAKTKKANKYIFDKSFIVILFQVVNIAIIFKLKKFIR
jgi:hypothetical protein